MVAPPVFRRTKDAEWSLDQLVPEFPPECGRNEASKRMIAKTSPLSSAAVAVLISAKSAILTGNLPFMISSNLSDRRKFPVGDLTPVSSLTSPNLHRTHYRLLVGQGDKIEKRKYK